MAKKKDALLKLDPEQELIFEGPFNRTISINLVLKNPSKSIRVAFKMKTTSPRLFFVRPNIGILDPKQQVSVEIYVQPVNLRADMQQKRHKFLILAAEALADVEMSNLQDFWKMQKPEDIWDTKLKCFLLANKDERMREAGGGSEFLSMPQITALPEPASAASQNGQDDKQETGGAAAGALVDDRSLQERPQLAAKTTLHQTDPITPVSVPADSSSKGRQFFFVVAFMIAIFAAILVAFVAGQLHI
ncbi:vesicle-associated membrane protein-associated protein A [Drosophila tropicalis]|uniref:vesicle-associated membrane protein-associated protein A n=1 Tax=Drosophila tropicalis TaxID=46794 RepID=UPI0035ABF4C9